MIAIVCADSNWGIGLNGGLLVRIPEDMKRFRKLTTGKTIILGRKTLETFPVGKSLPGRRNIVLTRNAGLVVDGAVTASSVDIVLEMTKELAPQDVFVVGGAQVYKQLLGYCGMALVTRLRGKFEADCFFPALDRVTGWKLVDASEWRGYDCEQYRYETYTF